MHPYLNDIPDRKAQSTDPNISPTAMILHLHQSMPVAYRILHTQGDILHINLTLNLPLTAVSIQVHPWISSCLPTHAVSWYAMGTTMTSYHYMLCVLLITLLRHWKLPPGREGVGGGY